MSNSESLVAMSARADVREAFDRRVERQANELATAFDRHEFDSPSFGVGLELEVYAVDPDGHLARLPDAVFETGIERELGRHNAELNTDPDELEGSGFSSQLRQLETQLDQAQSVAADHDREIVLDAMWTIPPADGTLPYLTDTDPTGRARNMTPSQRYEAIDRQIVEAADGRIPIDLPGVTATFPSILVESLTTSMQPHLQIPAVTDYPAYHNAAIRTLGPVLSLATNSPFLPVDLYDVEDSSSLLDRVHHESRIEVFEQSINVAWEKVKFPSDVEKVTDVIDRLVADETCAPFLREWLIDEEPTDAFVDQFWEFDHKRGTYWRWVRSVIGGQPVGSGDDCSIRIEYRPLPTQPTLVDTISLQAFVAGLVRGVIHTDHPVTKLPHGDAKDCFYDVVDNGPAATLAWVNAEGARTTHPDAIYEEMFDLAARGLAAEGLSDERIRELLAPIEGRWRQQAVPSQWKIDRVQETLDAGQSFQDAVTNMQVSYIEHSGAGTPFVEWDA